MKTWIVSILVLLSCISNVFGDASIQRVAIVDTGLDVNDPRFSNLICGYHSFTDENIEDTYPHGTHVAGLIKKYARDAKYCLIILKYYSDSVPGRVNTINFVKALEEAVKQHVSIVNYSGGGSDFNEEEYLIIKNNPDITFVVAAGNDHHNIDNIENHVYPASYRLPNIAVVGNINKDGTRYSSSNYGKNMFWEMGVNVLSTVPCNNYHKTDYNCEELMTGTSMSTAIFSGKLIYERYLNEHN